MTWRVVTCRAVTVRCACAQGDGHLWPKKDFGNPLILPLSKVRPSLFLSCLLSNPAPVPWRDVACRDVTVRCACAQKQCPDFGFAALADSLGEVEDSLPKVNKKEESIIDMEDGEPLAGIAVTQREFYSHVMRLWQSCRDTATRARLAKLFQLYCAGQE